MLLIRVWLRRRMHSIRMDLFKMDKTIPAQWKKLLNPKKISPQEIFEANRRGQLHLNQKMEELFPSVGALLENHLFNDTAFRIVEYVETQGPWRFIRSVDAARTICHRMLNIDTGEISDDVIEPAAYEAGNCICSLVYWLSHSRGVLIDDPIAEFGAERLTQYVMQLLSEGWIATICGDHVISTNDIQDYLNHENDSWSIILSPKSRSYLFKFTGDLLLPVIAEACHTLEREFPTKFRALHIRFKSNEV